MRVLSFTKCRGQKNHSVNERLQMAAVQKTKTILMLISCSYISFTKQCKIAQSYEILRIIVKA